MSSKAEAAQSLYVVSECCPVGCGIEVVMLRSIADASIFCFCIACSCGWASPSAAQFSSGLQSIDPLDAFAPGGVDAPTLEQIERAGHAESVLSVISPRKWGETIEGLNRWLQNHAAARNARPPQ